MDSKRLPQRKSPRLRGYDYSQSGAYFVTICTDQRQHLFGQVVDSETCLNTLGEIAQWHDLPTHFQQIELDAFVVMPNHVHGIVLITNDRQMTPTHDENSPTLVVSPYWF